MIALQSLALFLLLPALLGFLVSKHQSRRRKKKFPCRYGTPPTD